VGGAPADPDRRIARFWAPPRHFLTFEPEANLPNVVAPVFIAQGVFDFAAPPHAWAGELEKLPNATYRAFERSGHYPQLDEREPFGEAVAGWLGRGR